MVLSLFLPILLSAAALFVASFLSWMVFQLHGKDWIKLKQEDEFLAALRQLDLPAGSYMFPGIEKPEERNSEAYQARMKEGPTGVITVFRTPDMKRNLVLTFAYFLGVSFCVGYLGTLSLNPGAGFGEVFRFVTTASLIVFLAAIVQHAIWFQVRIVGHVVESLAYAVLTGAIFAALWPSA